jgi:hypothetical protein
MIEKEVEISQIPEECTNLEFFNARRRPED